MEILSSLIFRQTWVFIIHTAYINIISTSYSIHNTSCIIHHTSHITHLTSHISHLTSHITQIPDHKHICTVLKTLSSTQHTHIQHTHTRTHTHTHIKKTRRCEWWVRVSVKRNIMTGTRTSMENMEKHTSRWKPNDQNEQSVRERWFSLPRTKRVTL